MDAMDGTVFALVAAKCVLYYATFRCASGDGSSRRAAIAAIFRTCFGICMGCGAFAAAAMLPLPGVFVVALMAGRAMAWALSSDMAYRPSPWRRLVPVGLAVNVAVDVACCVALGRNPVELLAPLRY